MIRSVFVKGFTAIPYLETSKLMQHMGGKVKFSESKPNVIVGPNGSGKSALMKTLALRHLAYLTGTSRFENKYVDKLGGIKELWTEEKKDWTRDWAFMAGLDINTDNAPCVYYRPGMIPGDSISYTHAMCSFDGYFDYAKDEAQAVDDKSSGQVCQVLLARVKAMLDGKLLPTTLETMGWSYGLKARKFEGSGRPMPWEEQAEELKRMFTGEKPGIQSILLDEPEQSLDAVGELKLWKSIEQADTSKVQVIVATHSLHPFLHPERFNIIEAEDGYVDSVKSLL